MALLVGFVVLVALGMGMVELCRRKQPRQHGFEVLPPKEASGEEERTADWSKRS